MVDPKHELSQRVERFFLAVIEEEIKIEEGRRDFISPYRFRSFLLPRNASGGTIRFTVFPGLLLNNWSTGI